MRLYSLLPTAVLLTMLTTGGALRQAAVISGSLIKGTSAAVYYVGADEMRYVFPNDRTFFTWYSGFNGVTKVSDEELAGYRIGGNVTYRPGTRLVKIQSDPKVYAVARGGVLRWVKTETAARSIFGTDWNKKIDDISDSFFVNYTVGPDIASFGDFDPVAEQSASQTITDDKKLDMVVPPVTPPVASSCPADCGLGNACVANSCQAVPGPSIVNLKTVVIDYADVCFVGDPCVGGACCSVNGLQFADNANLKAVMPRDKYQYAGQQLCGRASVSTFDRSRFNQAMTLLSNEFASTTSDRVTVNSTQTRIYGEMTMSRVPGSCDWWMSPDDLRARFSTAVDQTTDAMFVFGSRTFDFGTVVTPDAITADQSSGIRGAGYSYIVKEWETSSSETPSTSIYRTSLKSQLDASVTLGITDPKMSYVGNHCRDNKKDLDETGVDCGGAGCNACPAY